MSAKLSRKAKDFIKSHGTQSVSGSKLIELSTLQSYTRISTEFPPEKRREIFHILRKVFYINFILEWKIFALIEERKMIQSEFKALCDKWECLDNIISQYNEAVEAKKFTDIPALVAVNMIEVCANGFAPLTTFKSGKVQLQNRHIQRTFEKLRNRHKKRLTLHAFIASILENYIKDNDLAEYITEEIKGFIKELQTDLAHAPKYSAEEFNIKYGFANDSNEKNEAQKFAVYPAFNEGVTEANEAKFQRCYNFLFSDLEQIERWQKEQWGI